MVLDGGSELEPAIGSDPAGNQGIESSGTLGKTPRSSWAGRPTMAINQVNIRWKIIGSPKRSTSNVTGRMFATYQGVGTGYRYNDHIEPGQNRYTKIELHRTVTVIMRHDRGGRILATGKEARALALRALIRVGATEVHQTIDPDEEVL